MKTRAFFKALVLIVVAPWKLFAESFPRWSTNQQITVQMTFNAQPYFDKQGEIVPGGLFCLWSTFDIPAGATKMAVRYVGQDVEVDVMGITPVTIGKAPIGPNMFPSGQSINVFGQPQDQHGNTVGMPTNAVFVTVP